jgi:hypothetical protein
VSNSASKKKKKKGKIGELRGQSPGEEKLTALRRRSPIGEY